MALHQFALLPNATLSFRTKMLPSIMSSGVPRTIQCKASTSIVVSDQTNASRRSVNYFQPSIWHYDYIQSLGSDFAEESYAAEGDRLKEEVRVMLFKLANPVDQLDLIDVLQRLGVAAHFGLEIRNLTENIYHKNKGTLKGNKNLHATALEFRILRQHGYDASSEIFKQFLDDEGNFDTRLSFDIEGLISLYEASFLSMEGETILHRARDFSLTCLREFVGKDNNKDDEMCLLVNHALGLPLHWRTSRLEARWFIDVYEKRDNMSPALLQFAKLDFNILQANHQEDLKHASRWWNRIGLAEKLSFSRDRLVENFFWTVGLAYEPQFGRFRRVMTKVNALITTIDDTYDVYGELEELQLFTEVVDRWDINAIDILPEYMKICFLALYNFVNEIAFEFLKENGKNITPVLKKAWADLCKSYLVEAKWYYGNYQPSLQEYLENAWISISAPVSLVHAYFLLTSSTKMEDLICLEEDSDIIRSSATILRLADDLGTSEREMETGDVPKSIQCCMKETGASEEDARRHINSLIIETWKKMNKEARNSSFSQDFIQIAMNFARMSLCMYQHGDGHSDQDPETKNRITSILFHPIV
ncbi:terpene synthase 10-like [Prosopis cineraria]|uniref:terpene synthase 10-like n=1 Tax=Prosopis cineraria TaxID=364024 RepID=UPI0024105EF0|nr:terpene synthase 10-like [Prosopis cineraria]